MSQFSVCRIKDETAIKYHHDLGPFDIYLLKNKENESTIRFFCPTPLTSFLFNSAQRRALKALSNFSKRIGYHTGETLSFKDALHILGVAQNYGGNPLKNTTVHSKIN